jgi:hypothetical protein
MLKWWIRLRQADRGRARVGERPALRHEGFRRKLRYHHGIPLQGDKSLCALK